jgi:peptidoglycan/xylan/chitin deacetylase (PgdA/CDA1 family)
MRVVALTFHDVLPHGTPAPAAPTAPSTPNGDAIYSLTESQLEQLMTQLRRLGYQGVASRDFRGWQLGRHRLPERSVVLTFDDGYAAHLSIIAPMLVRYHFTGTFFVTVNHVGTPGFLTWDQLRQLVFLGMEVGSHGLSHAPLTGLPRPSLDEELVQSKRILERELGVPIRSIAAPGGFWNAAVAEAVERAGYETAWLSNIGLNGAETHPLALRRVVARQPFSVDRIVPMVEGWQPAFWWAANQQLLIRGLKRMLGVYWYEQLKRRLVPHA